MLHVLNCVIDSPYGIVMAPYKYLEAFVKTDELVKEHVEFHYLDCVSMKSPELIRQVITDEKIGIVCFSCNMSTVSRAARIASEIKQSHPNIVVICGGSGFSQKEEVRRYLTESPAFDVIIRGEGEIPFREVLRAILRNKPWEGIQGIGYRTKNSVVITESQHLVTNLNEIPFPYNEQDLRHNREILYLSRRGCSRRCRYCAWSAQSKTYSARALSSQRIQEDLRRFFAHGTESVFIADSCFTGNRDELAEMLRFIAAENTRTRIFAYIHEEFLDDRTVSLLSKARVLTGIYVQSLNKEAHILAGRKPFTQSELDRVVRLFVKYDIRYFDIDLILGLPGDTYGSFKDTVVSVLNTLVNTRAKFETLVIDPMKVLPGSYFFDNRDDFGIVAMTMPPYLVYETGSFSREDMKKAIELTKTVNLSFNNKTERHRFVAAARHHGGVEKVLSAFMGWLSENHPSHVTTETYPVISIFETECGETSGEKQRYCLAKKDYTVFFERYFV